jgi:hypothetical protein
MEPMCVRVEIWPLAADEIGIWLLSGDDAWRPSLPVGAASEPHAEVELALSEKAIEKDSVALVHSTSWRTDGPAVVLTYVVVLRPPSGLVRDDWPKARPVSVQLPDAVGKPPVNDPTEPPAPRYVDVLLHAVRHLRFLLDTDSTARDALTGAWCQHLPHLEPALAGMYVREDLPQTAQPSGGGESDQGST